MRTMAAACLGALAFLAAAPALGLELAGFGDSITQGVPYINYIPNGERVGGYEPTLENLFSESGVAAQVLNYGWAGERTTGGLARIDGVLAEKGIQILLLLEGTNDLVDGTSPATVSFNLGVMVDRALDAGILPVVGTITPDLRPDRFKPIDETNALIRQMAAAKGVPHCELYGGMVDGWGSWSDDLLHPNEAGYVRMAGIWHGCAAPLSPPPPRLPVSGGKMSPVFDLLLE